MSEGLVLRYYWERLAYKTLMASKSAYRLVQPRLLRQTVFVAGMQRSGTNMLMDLIERSMDTDVFHERDGRAFDNYRMRERVVIGKLREASRAPVFVIKALCELDELTALMRDFAPARTVWIVRDYRDAVNSALASFGNFTRQVARIAADRGVDDWRAHGMSEQTHALVRGLYHPGMSEASAAALIWYFRNLLFFQQGLDGDERALLVAYENLVQAPQETCRRVFDFLGLSYTPWITRHVFASSVGGKAAPVLDPGVEILCQELGARFRQHLSEVQAHD